MKTKTAVLNGKPDAGNPRVRFDEGGGVAENLRRIRKSVVARVAVACLGVSTASAGYAQIQAQTVMPRTVVSDVASFTCGSGPFSTLSADRTLLYVPYLASRDGIGECHDISALSVVPIANPAQTEHYVVAEKGQTIGGVASTSVMSFTSYLWQGKLRVNLVVNYAKMVWRDWDPLTHQVVGEGTYKCKFGADGEVCEMSPQRITDYLNAQGQTGHNVLREAGDRMLVQSKPVWIDGVLYGFVTSSCSQPILFRCSDGETLEFIGVVPAICEYECQLAYLNGRFYAVMRGATGNNFFVTDAGSHVFKPAGRVPDGLQRPQMLVHGGRVLIGYSAPDEKPSGVRNGRNNLHLLLGEGADLAQYREMMHIQESIGFVYPDLVDVNGELYVVWSNAERYPTTEKWGAVQGKDQLLFGKIGQLDFDNPPPQVAAPKSVAPMSKRKTVGWIKPSEKFMCITTDYTPKTTDRFVVRIVFDKDKPVDGYTSACVWCARTAAYGDSMSMFWLAKPDQKGFSFVCGNGTDATTYIPMTVRVGDEFVFDVDYAKKTVSVNGVSYVLNSTQLTTAGGPLWIFGSRDGANPPPGSPSFDIYRMRSFQVYAEDGTPRLNLVPTYDDETDVASFLDAVSGDFLSIYVPQGATYSTMNCPIFEKQGFPPAPGYRRLEWVRAVGTQYVNTEYVAPVNAWLTDTIEMKVRFEKLAVNTVFWCERCAANSEAPSIRLARRADGTFVADRGRYQHLTTDYPIATQYVQVDGLNTKDDVLLKCRYNQASESDPSTFYVNGVAKATLGGQNWQFHGEPLFVFASSNGSTVNSSPFCGGSYRTYSFRVTDKNGVVKVDLVPALQKATGIAGFYDLARRKFIAPSSFSGKDPASFKYGKAGMVVYVF